MTRRAVLRFERVGERNEWTWFFIAAGNSEPMARCTETHPDLSDALHSAGLVLGGPVLQVEEGGDRVVNSRPDVRVEVVQ